MSEPRTSSRVLGIYLNDHRLGVEGKASLRHAHLLVAADRDNRQDPDRLAEWLNRARQQRTVPESPHDAAAAALLAPSRPEGQEMVVGP